MVPDVSVPAANDSLPPMSKPLTFLAVDDDPDGILITRRSLLKTFPDAEVVACDGGASALELLQDQKVDAVVTDQRMGEMEGLTLIRKIRMLDQDVPIVMVTGMEHLETDAREAGANYFLPMSQWRELPQVMQNLLGVTAAA